MQRQIKKINVNNKHRLYERKTARLVWGVLFFFFGLFGFVGDVQDAYIYDYSGLIMGIAFMFGGLAMVYSATKANLNLERYHAYNQLIFKKGVFSIDMLARSMDKTYAETLQDLDLLVRKGYLQDMSVNRDTRMIEGLFVSKYKASVKSKMVRCPGCGANNEVIEHETTECEYCGRKLKYEAD